MVALEQAGLVRVSRVPVDPNYERRRVRNIYSIDPALLDEQIDTTANSQWNTSVEPLGMTPRKAWAR